jgi:hypothetical protein
MDKQSILDKLRAWPWLVAAVITTAIVALIAPYQIGVLAWSLSKLAIGAYLGYWIDRSIFPYARPGSIANTHRHMAAIRRAIIVAATVLALGLGV